MSTRKRKSAEISISTRRKTRNRTTKRKPPLSLWTYILAHGRYTKEKESLIEKEKDSFTIPYNIRLIQYSGPRSVLNFTDAYFIVKQLSTIKRDGKIALNMSRDPNNMINTPPVLVEKTGKGISYLPNKAGLNYYRKIEPNTLISNMLVTHGDHTDYSPYYRLHYIYPNGKVHYLDTEADDTDLKTVLNKLSDAYEKEWCKKSPMEPLNVVQITCQSGKYYNIEELRDDMARMSIEGEKYECLNTDYLMDFYDGIPEEYFDWLNKNYIIKYEEPYSTKDDLNFIKQMYCNNLNISPKNKKAIKSPKKDGVPMDIDISPLTPTSDKMDVDYFTKP